MFDGHCLERLKWPSLEVEGVSRKEFVKIKDIVKLREGI